MFFLPRMYPPKIVRIKDTITRIKNPYGECANGTGTFIPQKLAIIVGIDLCLFNFGFRRFTAEKLLTRPPEKPRKEKTNVY